MCVWDTNLLNKTASIQKNPAFKKNLERFKTIQPDHCRHVGPLSMTFSITKAYRQKTKGMYRIGGVSALSDNHIQLVVKKEIGLLR